MEESSLKETINTVFKEGGNEVTALGMASMCGSKSCLPLLLESGADFNMKCKGMELEQEEKLMWQRNPLHLAVKYGNVDCARILLEAGIDVNQKSIEKLESSEEFVQSALDIALQKRQIDLVDLICKYKISTTEDLGEETKKKDKKVHFDEKIEILDPRKETKGWLGSHRWELAVGVGLVVLIAVLMKRKR